MNKLKVAFIIYRPLSQRDYIRYGIKELVSSGVACNVIDISTFVHPELTNITVKNDFINGSDIAVKKINNIESLQSFIKVQDIKKVISTGIIPVKVHKALKSAGAVTAVQLWGSVPSITKKTFTVQKLRNITIKKLWSLLLSKVFNYTEIYDYLLYAGNRGLTHYVPRHLYKNAIACHSYDFYLNQLQVNKNNTTPQHIVFIDQMLPFHSDHIIQGKKKRTSKAYYDRLNSFFTKLEAYTNLKVIIASHPRIGELDFDYSKVFNGRTVLVNQTSELIHNSQLCLAHFSTAVNHAVMAKVPVLLLEDPILTQLNVIGNFGLMQRSLQCNVINLNEPISINDSIYNIDDIAYDKYTRDFITTSSDENKTNGQIVTEQFLDL
jgi:hypothetical protein